jgi:sarcosine oxidase subunit gamma
VADLALQPRGALDGLARPGHAGRDEGAPGVTLSIRPPGTQALVLAHSGQAKILVDASETRGLALPGPGRAHVARDLTLVAMGPTQWLAISDAPGTDLIGSLFAPLASACTVVRTDDARTVVEIAGPSARDVLAKMLTIDLHPRVFRSGHAAVTLAGTIAVTLWQTDETPRYVLAFARSFAGSFWHWLTESAAEYGYIVETSAA